MRQRSLYAFFTFGLLVGALARTPAARADADADTTDGNQEREGGIKPNESYGQSADDVIKKFKDGRTTTFKLRSATKSRWSGIAESHDHDMDGVSDEHALNAMEKAMDDAAGMTYKTGAPRDEEFRKARAKVDKENNEALDKRYRARETSGEKNLQRKTPFQSISPILVDKGAAHGDKDTEEHRVYELTDAAKKGATKIGDQYGKQSIADAGKYKFDGKTIRDDGDVVKRGSSDNEIVVNGQKMGVNADIDLMRSEADWLEQQKARQVRNQWKAVRASRLAGYNGQRDLAESKQLTNAVAKAYDSGNDSAGDAAVEKQIAYDAAAAQTQLCKDSGTYKVLKSNERCTGPTTTLMDLQGLPSSQIDKNQLAQARAAATAAPNAKVLQDFKKNLAGCMQAGKWCKEKEKFKLDTSSDVGGTFHDTREFVYHQFDQASKQGAGRFNANVTSGDFSAATDARTQTSVYADYQKQLSEQKAKLDAFRAAEMQKQAQHPGYKSPYLGAQYSDQKSFAELSRRDLNRGDGSSLDNSSNYGGAPGASAGTRQPAAAVRTTP